MHSLFVRKLILKRDLGYTHEITSFSIKENRYYQSILRKRLQVINSKFSLYLQVNKFLNQNNKRTSSKYLLLLVNPVIFEHSISSSLLIMKCK